MDNSMDVDEVEIQDALIKDATEDVNNLNISENTEQLKDDDEFGDDNLDDIDIDEDDIKFLMSPQPGKTMKMSTQSNSTNLNFNSTQNSIINSNTRVTSINSSVSQKFLNLSIEDKKFLDNLKNYYEFFFPIKKYYKWLSYGNVDKDYFTHREFSFTLHPEVYLRFQSFETEKEFKEKLLEYIPKKIDIGAVYNSKPKTRKTIMNRFKPKEKELVFDIDMTDYDDIRTCCTGGNICKKCWTFMTISIKIIDRALRDDFGFKKILWVYSGRRGVHCWVCDNRARKLSESARKAIVSYLEIIKGGEQQSRKVKLPKILHPSLNYAYDIIKQYFPKLILEDMDIFNKEEYYENLLSIIPYEDIRNNLRNSWKNSIHSPQNKWNEFVKEIEREKSKARKPKKNELENLERDIIFQYTYPRLDFNVSLHLNHLLKSPFCIHPGTGRVCVPINPENCDDFNPFDVPTLNELCEEIDSRRENGISPSPNDLQNNTAIAPYIKQFSDFVKSLEDEINQMRIIKREISERNLDY
ncbi:prim-pol domain-containing protein [Piromyces finnis]|uniref:DNA primase n=1 Tax=Piromyces finnis TaxID=1754191 RepID=A0A1Y1VM54_9FUNG|nr:prim-pol domain-containing protein [Piromyces finnis]|eukprot:ORX58577.1 prim-pol domain-containing protein [Piromyces finnis]